jgi:hypothetical protein
MRLRRRGGGGAEVVFEHEFGEALAVDEDDFWGDGAGVVGGG